MSEPREFYLADSYIETTNGQVFRIAATYLPGVTITGKYIPVIEKEAYDKLKKENKKLREALAELKYPSIKNPKTKELVAKIDGKKIRNTKGI